MTQQSLSMPFLATRPLFMSNSASSTRTHALLSKIDADMFSLGDDVKPSRQAACKRLKTPHRCTDHELAQRVQQAVLPIRCKVRRSYPKIGEQQLRCHPVRQGCLVSPVFSNARDMILAVSAVRQTCLKVLTAAVCSQQLSRDQEYGADGHKAPALPHFATPC